MLGDRAVAGIAFAVTALWIFLNVFDAVAGPAYDTPVMVHTIMGLVAGSAFGEKIRRARPLAPPLSRLGLTEREHRGNRDDGEDLDDGG